MHPDRARWATPLVFALLFVSGAVGLAYEVVWTRAVAEVIGTSGEASAIVLATFMGGLALGAYALGGLADRARRPLALYGVLELGIGLAALAFPFLLDLVSRAYLSVSPALPAALRPVARAVLVASVLLVPTACMGGTLPVLVRHFAHALPRLRTQLARLYGINSLGAGLGAFLAGVFWIPAIGLSATLRSAAAISLAIGAVALWLGRAEAPRVPDVRAIPPPSDEPGGPNRRRAAMAGMALTGFSALLGEVAFIRLLSLVTGSSPYAFTLIVTAYVLGIGLGSAWISQRRDTGDSLRFFGWLQLGLVLALGLAVPLYVRLPFLFWHASHALLHSAETWPLYQLLTFATCGLVVGPATFLLGAAFPTGARAVAAGDRGLGREVGRAYLFNTLGTVLGAGLGGLWLLPRVGLEGVFALAIAGHGVAALASLLVTTEGPGRRRAGVAVAGVLCLLLGLQRTDRGWSAFVAGVGSFRLKDAPPPRFETMRAAWQRAQRVLFHEDDAGASVVVTEEPSTRVKSLFINGKADANSGTDLSTQVLLGQMGVLLHRAEVRHALVIGLGSGVTAGSLLTHPIERLEVLELSPAVARAAALFRAESGDALNDPRLQLHVEDARSFMRASTERYDLIVSEPSNPWTVGASALFTREFFQRASAHLTEEGVLVQWVHTYESSEALVKLVVRTLRETFPFAVTWLGPQDLLLIAGRRPLEPSLSALSARMERPRVRADLARIGIHTPAALLALQLQSAAGQRVFAGDGPINTTDHNLLEFAAPIAFFIDAPFELPDERRRAGPEPLFLQREMSAGFDSATLRSIHEALRALQPTEAPILDSVATRWLELEPTSDEAAWWVALSAYARKDYGGAWDVLRARPGRGERTAAFVEAYFHVAAARANHRRSLFQPNAGEADAEFAEWAAKRFADTPTVQRALRRYTRSTGPKTPGPPDPLDR